MGMVQRSLCGGGASPNCGAVSGMESLVKGNLEVLCLWGLAGMEFPLAAAGLLDAFGIIAFCFYCGLSPAARGFVFNPKKWLSPPESEQAGDINEPGRMEKKCLAELEPTYFTYYFPLINFFL